MGIMHLIFARIKKLFAKDNQPISIKIRAEKSNVNIFLTIRKD